VLVFKHLLLVVITLTSLHAHQSRENYITIVSDAERLTLQCEIESDNFSKVVAIDDNSNGIVSWRELRVNEDKIVTYLLKSISLTQEDQKIALRASNYEVYRRDDQSYLRLNLVSGTYDLKKELLLNYQLFFDMDALQRVFVLSKMGAENVSMLLTPRQRSIVIQGKKQTLLQQSVSFFMEGVWHIWSGYDHLLFLLMLLLPALIEKHEGVYRRSASVKKVFIKVLKIVTLFSLAHSLTLGVAFFDYATINPKIIEIFILISIVITALINILGLTPKRLYILIFTFGLLHGFGFANALNEMTLSQGHVVLTLLGFNLGVEVGQIVLVVAAMPLLYAVAGSKFYHPWVIRAVSSLTVAVSFYWLYVLLGR